MSAVRADQQKGGNIKMHLLISLFWLGVIIWLAMMVFSFVSTILMGVLAAIVGSVYWALKKLRIVK